jgi:uncharacterized protein YdaT
MDRKKWLSEKIKKLMEEGYEEKQAIAIAYKMAKEMHDSKTAIIATAGTYLYLEDGELVPKIKEAGELDAAYEEDAYYPLQRSHEDPTLVGVVSHCMTTEDGKVIGTIDNFEEDLPEGSGVSAGFQAVEEEEGGRIYQRQMEIEHVAASAALEPRGDANRVIDAKEEAEQDMANNEEVEKLKKELDAKNAEIVKFHAERDSVEKLAIITAIRSKLQPEFAKTLDGLSLGEIALGKKFLDNAVQETKKGEVDAKAAKYAMASTLGISLKDV